MLRKCAGVVCRSAGRSLTSRQSLACLSARTISSGTPGHNSPHGATASAEADGRPYLANLKTRGLYNEHLVKHVQSYKIQELKVLEQGKYVDITWSDGHQSRFHALWLRHNCHCEDCKLDHNGMLTINFNDIDEGLRVTSVRMEGDDVAIFRWSGETGEKEHEGPIPTYWLRHYCYSEEAESQRREQRTMKFYKEKTVPEVEYAEVMESDQGLYKWLVQLSERGICLVKNVPTQEGMVAKMAEKIAPLQHTIYGETFDVVSTPQPINAAYSPVRLDLHMDQPHYESPPGLQMLHCIEFDPNVVGGDNTFADLQEIAHQFREERPDLFDVLARVPISMQTVHYDRAYPVHIRTKRPIFTLNDREELVGVIWHPMLVGPLQADQADIEPFYKAYKYFFNMVNAEADLYKLRMVAGDLISFNNRRVLHGRAAYSNQTGRRFLQGTYVEISEFQSLVQVFHNKYGDGRLAMRPGSFSWD
ncbi:gamma-butyrobetaine dioxygenase [Aplysia californica]|uniref:Gamma-butyrobetaine dioxygenase n=1 Tax=Aplysia californica TaxID=6500 RepID=A0ABM1AFQ0_APLCA|nr:gamma-butyrobetaine dioxygenase [Aplysia californica]